MIYPNSFVRDLAEFEKRSRRPSDGAIRDHVKGFVEVPIEQDPPQEKLDQAEAEICPLSPAQLRDVGAVTAEVAELREGSHFIKLAYHIGNQKRTAEAFCTYSSALKAGDELYIMVKERGRQQTIIVLGLRADQKEG